MKRGNTWLQLYLNVLNSHLLWCPAISTRLTAMLENILLICLNGQVMFTSTAHTQRKSLRFMYWKAGLDQQQKPIIIKGIMVMK